MILGTDGSIEECKREGYLIVEFDENEMLNVNKHYRFIKYLPDYLFFEECGSERPIIFDIRLTPKDVGRMYLLFKKEIDETVGFENSVYSIRTFKGLVSLLEDVISYTDIILKS